MKNEEMIYVQAARGKRPKTIPIVVEIQSVTSPTNKKIREKYGFEGVMRNPELSAQCTVNPITEVGYDAAIHVSDLLLPLEAMGLDITISEQGGPTVKNAVRTMEDVKKLRVPEPEESMTVWLEAMRIAKKELTGKVPLIGWVGGPLSTSSFIIEGRMPGINAYHLMKLMMHAEPETLHGLLTKLTDFYVKSISAQAKAGADVMMLLDLHAPAVMSPEDYREFSYPYMKRMADAAKATGLPVLFASDGTSFLDSPVEELKADVLGVSWVIDIAQVIKRFGGKQVVQGNLEPHVLFAPEKVIEKKVKAIVEAGKAAPAHIFSLGGWIIRSTPFEKAKFLVDLVHSL